MTAAQVLNPQHSSESREHMTPPDIVEAAREVLQVIELDPASTALANERICARMFYTERENGLAQRWRGRVFLNPPGGLCDAAGRPVIHARRARRSRPDDPGCTISGSCGLAAPHEHEGVTSQAKVWWSKLAQHWRAGDVECAIFVGFSIEILQSTQAIDERLVTPMCCPFCVPRERVRFLSVTEDGVVVGNQPTHASVIVYLPPRYDIGSRRFESVFSKFGTVRL